MIRPVILLTLGLSLLAGCERGDRPTVRQTAMRSGDESTASTAPNPPDDDATCPGSPGPHRIRPKREPRAFAKADGATHSRPAEGDRPKTTATKSVKIGDASPAKTAATSPPKGTAVSPAKTAAATPPKAAGRDAAEGDSRDVRIGGLRLEAPKNWTREQPPMEFILAEFSLPRAQGDASDAQLTVTSPGENSPRGIERLRKQLKEKLQEGSIEHLQIGGNEVVLVDTSGEDEEDEEEGDPAAKKKSTSKSRYRALNAMVFAGDKVYFINCTGPEKTVDERVGEFRAFLQTLKPVK